MNKKELSEIRKNFSESSGFFTLDRVLTAYVDTEKNVLFKENKNYALIPEDEGTVLFGTLKKALGGSLGKHLVEYAFPERAYEDGGMHGSLALALRARLRNTVDEYQHAVDPLLHKIVDEYDCSGAYAIIIGYCTYSITSCRDENEEDLGDADYEYNFIVTALCPACTGDDGLIFDRDNASIIKKSNTDLIISKKPADGFLYPVFSDRQPDPNSVLIYSKSPKKPNISMVEDVLDCNFKMSCQSEKVAFGKILSEVLGDDLSYSVITQVNDELRSIATEFRNETEMPLLTSSILNGILYNVGFKDIDTFPIFRDITGGSDSLRVENLIENKVVLKTPEVTVSVAGVASDKVRTSVQDGRKCLVIDLDDASVAVNDINVRL